MQLEGAAVLVVFCHVASPSFPANLALPSSSHRWCFWASFAAREAHSQPGKLPAGCLPGSREATSTAGSLT